MSKTATRISTACAALLIAGLLALSTAFAPCAWASPLIAVQDTTSGTTDSDSSGSASTTPTTTTLYVIKSIGPTSYTYNKKGQLTAEKGTDSGATSKITYKYKKNHITSFKSTSASKYRSSSTSSTVSYDSKGRMSKVAGKGSVTYSLKYTYNAKGQVTKESGKKAGNKVSQKFTYDKKGRVSKIKSSTSTATVKYDGKSNIKSVSTKFGKFDLFTGYKYSYKNGRATSRGVKYTKTGSTYYAVKVKYKQVTIPTKYASQVKAQQYALMNPSVSFALPR